MSAPHVTWCCRACGYEDNCLDAIACASCGTNRPLRSGEPIRPPIPASPMQIRYIYVAGPIGANDACRAARLTEAVVAGRALLKAGLRPFVPHLWAAACDDADDLLTVEQWMEYDFGWLARCDAVLRIPGLSPGADREVAHAHEIGLPVFFTVDGLLEWAHRRDP